jgi:processive 1,2-diacylglycerol beta-glucosyltransferase
MEKNKRKKAYIFTVTAGAGHLKAGEALYKMFIEKFLDWDVEIFDVLDYSNTLFRKRYAKSYNQIIDTMPELWGIIYEKTDNTKISKRIAGIRNFFNSINARKMINLIKKNPPDVAICTHFLPAEILSGLSRKKEIEFPWACVVTDFEVHGFWMYENTDLYIVPTELAKHQLIRNNIPEERVVVLGIPISPEFSIEKDRSSIIKKMELQMDLKTILVMSGGFGFGPVENIVRYIDNIEDDFQIIIVAGKNKELESNLKKINFIKHTKVLGFVDNIDELLTISDLLVSKPGGLTTSEALSKGVPMVIVNAIPGQESRNSDFLMENGVAIGVASPEDIGFKIKELLREDGRIEKMKDNARRLSKPKATENIINEIINRWF